MQKSTRSSALCGTAARRLCGGRSSATLRNLDVLSAYAERAASRAVRDNDHEILLLGTIAIALALQTGEREPQRPLPLLEDACTRLGESFADIVDQTAKSLGRRPSRFLSDWAHSPQAHPTIAAMEFKAEGDGSAFRYVYMYGRQS
jgi:hypothetical protein